MKDLIKKIPRESTDDLSYHTLNNLSSYTIGGENEFLDEQISQLTLKEHSFF